MKGREESEKAKIIRNSTNLSIYEFRELLIINLENKWNMKCRENGKQITHE